MAPQTTKNIEKEGVLCKFIRKDFYFKSRNYLDKFDSTFQTFSIEIANESVS